MSSTDLLGRVRLPSSHYFVTVARGQRVHTLALRASVIWLGLALSAITLIWAGASTAYIAFHDDMLASYLVHTARMQNAYEDRIAEARAELDRVASRQLLDQTSFEGQMHDLLSRQARIEQHDKIIETLASEVAGGVSAAAVTASVHPAAPAKEKRPASEDPHGQSLSRASPTGADLVAAASNAVLDASARLGLVDFSLDSVEHSQIATLAGLADRAETDAARYTSVIARTGLSPDQLTAPTAKEGVGGPYVPLDSGLGAPAFDRAFAKAARDVERDAQLRRLMAYVPVREPLIGQAAVSSPFGYRIDPFLGKPELHPGVDLVEPFGSEIRATAAGRVTHAGWMGGYGEMVEIDHGNGLATRYGHMSDVLVAEGDFVKAGQPIGRIGSTGRSTGPHLHYEVRVDGEPVDPERFLGAGDKLTDLAAN